MKVLFCLMLYVIMFPLFPIKITLFIAQLAYSIKEVSFIFLIY